MSHFSRISAEITDFEAVRAAVNKMGFDLCENAPCRYYYGTKRCDAVVKLPGRYDVGLTRAENSYNLTADFFGGHVEKYVGIGCCKLIKSYAIEKLKLEAVEKGLDVIENSEGLVLIDPETGGEIIASFDLEGNPCIRTVGFNGTSCMKFKDIEEALGNIIDCNYSSEYYSQGEEEPQQLKQYF